MAAAPAIISAGRAVVGWRCACRIARKIDRVSSRLENDRGSTHLGGVNKAHGA